MEIQVAKSSTHMPVVLKFLNVQRFMEQTGIEN
jgi:hypothetical protein